MIFVTTPEGCGDAEHPILARHDVTLEVERIFGFLRNRRAMTAG
jgi:hypothetical protein